MMSKLDRRLISLRRGFSELINEVKEFLGKTFEQAAKGSETLCPYHDCKNCYSSYRNMVEDQLFKKGFFDGYNRWISYKKRVSSSTQHPSNNDEDCNSHDDIDELFYDTFRNIEDDAGHEEEVRERLSKDAKKIFRLVKKGKKELYPVCEKFNKLSFIIWLYLLKLAWVE